MDKLKRSRYSPGEAGDETLPESKRPRLDDFETSLSSRLVDNSHNPIAPAPHHMSNMSDITKRLQAAVQEGWSRKFSSYDSVHVLILVWEDDEPDLKNDLTTLEGIFTSIYHFGTETCRIKAGRPDRELRAKVVDFLQKNNSPANLLLVYYAGHARASAKAGEPPLWIPRRQNAPYIPSGAIQGLFDDSDCDVLLLYDCWNSPPQPLGQPPNAISRRSVTEVLAAGSFDTAPTELPSSSFTRALADELMAASKSGSLKISDLHARLSARLRIVKPRGRGRPPKEPQLKAPEEHLPLHYWLSDVKRSIILTPFSTRDEPQVLLCIRVVSGQSNVSEWINWIYQAPYDVRDLIKMEGVRSGFSTMVILRVPVAIWHRLPDSPSGSFVGFTTTGDLDPGTQYQIEEGLARKLATEPEPDEFISSPPGVPEEEDGYSLRIAPKKTRKALPTGRKLLPSERTIVPIERRDFVAIETFEEPKEQPLASPTERKALPSARKPVKISIKSAGQVHYCQECNGAAFKDEEGLANHIRKQHTRPFQCVFNWAGCDSTFASKNEWKRHVMSQHILLYYWLCQQETCAKVVNTLSSTPGKLVETNGNGHRRGPSLPNGALFNRKDLYTQHLRRMHTPPAIKKQIKLAKAANKTATGGPVQEWEERLRDLQQIGHKERCQLPTYMKCPAVGCDMEFTGANAWDDRMEHVAKHLEKASAGKEPYVIFGGEEDPTLTEWSTRPEVGIVRHAGANGWQLDNPLRPEMMVAEASGRERSKSVIEVAENEGRESAD